METRPLHGALGRTINYCAETGDASAEGGDFSVKAIQRARGGLARIPKVEDHTSIKEAATELGWKEDAVRYRMKIAGVKPKRVKVKGKDGRPRKRGYVPTWLIAQWKAKEPAPTDEITVRDAAQILGITIAGVESQIKKGFLTARPGEITSKDGSKREGRILSRKEAEARRDSKAAKYGAVAEQRRLEKAVSVLKEILADGKPHLRSEVVKQAKEKRVTHKHVKKAKKDLKVRTTRPDRFCGPGYWQLPNAAPDEPSIVVVTKPDLESRTSEMSLDWMERS